jgi:hypothetical protein
MRAKRSTAWPTVLALVTLAAVAGKSRAATPAPILPVQRLEQDKGPISTRESTHFKLRYNPQRLSDPAAAEAERLAENGWQTCVERFGYEPEKKITLDLTPLFQGATGFAFPQRQGQDPFVGVRYGELDYLGIDGEYVLTHEIAHVFSRELAGTALGEGIADWAAGRFSSLPMRQWWGEALRQQGLWIDPEAFFITGDFPSSPEVNAVIRTSQYVEAGLLVQFLVERFGWEKFRAFAVEFDKTRGRLIGNEDRARIRPPRRSDAPKEQDPRLPPNTEAVRALFSRHFGESWQDLRKEWERGMTVESPKPQERERLTLGMRLYGAVRNYEMWLVDQRNAPSREVQETVRQTFTDANRTLKGGDIPGARAKYVLALAMVDRLKRPAIET